MRQVRVEYDQLEMKRRLLTQHDFFLADAKISGLLAHKLGSTFYRKKQLPTPLKMDSKDLKAAIERALHKSVMKLHGTGQSYTLAVANGKHTAQEACENIHAVLLQLVNKFPGGWNNVRSLHLKHPLSMAIPIYMTLSEYLISCLELNIIRDYLHCCVFSQKIKIPLKTSLSNHFDRRMMLWRVN